MLMKTLEFAVKPKYGYLHVLRSELSRWKYFRLLLSAGRLISAILLLTGLSLSSFGQLQFEKQLKMTSWQEDFLAFEYYDAVELPDKTFAVYVGGVKLHPTDPNTHYLFSGLVFVDEFGDYVLDGSGLIKHFFFPIGLVNSGTYTYPEVAAKSLVYLEDGTFILYGIGMDKRFTMLKVDMNGNVIYTRKLNLAQIASCANGGGPPQEITFDQVYDATLLSDGKILFLCKSKYSFANGPGSFHCRTYLALLRMNQDGTYDNFYYEYHYLEPFKGQGIEGSKVRESRYGGYIFGFVTRSMLQYRAIGTSGIVEVKTNGNVNWIVDNVPFKDWVELENDHFVSVGFSTVHNVYNGNIETKGEICEWTLNGPYGGGYFEYAAASIEDAKLMSVQKKGSKYVCVGSYGWSPLLTTIADDLSSYDPQGTFTFQDDNALLLDIKETEQDGYIIGGIGERRLDPYSIPSTGLMSVAALDPYLIRVPTELETWCPEPREIPFESVYLYSSASGHTDPVTANLSFSDEDIEMSWELLVQDELCCTEAVGVEGDAWICASGSSNLIADFNPMPGDDFYWVHDGEIVDGSFGLTEITVRDDGNYYFFVELANGCLGQGYFRVNYYSNPTWSAPGTFGQPKCTNTAPMNLHLNNEPNAGTWSGPGVTGSYPHYQFDPALAGPGNHTIHVHYVDSYGCQWDFDFVIKVYGLSSPLQAPSIPGDLCVNGSVYNLPGSGNWWNINTQQSITQINPSQYCIGCTIQLRYCETINYTGISCNYCDPDTFEIVFLNCLEGKKALAVPSYGEDPGYTIHVYPNPADDFVEIRFSIEDSYSVQIRDVLGRIVAASVAEGDRLRLSTQTLSPGVYMVEVNNGIQTRTLKLVVE